jgi:NAD(P)-dependent dehydrogenase (short-subunit alcohol dehydrogenase family)
VLITGASKGIGAAIAKAFAQEGCTLHLAARGKAELEALAHELGTAHNVDIAIYPVDLSTSDGVRMLAEACGDADILVNNAGAVGRGALGEVDEATWRQAWDLKVFGYINLSRLIFQHMCERRDGVIINIVGMAAERPDFYYIVGSSGNAALNMFTQSLGGESMRFGVRVVAVNPGPIDSAKYRRGTEWRAERQYGDKAKTQLILDEMPSGRPGRADEVADAVIFLASSRASYISGASLRIDGGLFARPPRA